jgi:hypothetical protein
MYLVGEAPGGARVCPLSSIRWKCDSKFGVDSATDSTRSGLNTVTALLAIPYSSTVARKMLAYRSYRQSRAASRAEALAKSQGQNKLRSVEVNPTHERRRWGAGSGPRRPLAEWTLFAIIVGGDEQSTCMKVGKLTYER